MDQKYGKSPQQRLDEALKQVMPRLKSIVGESGNAKQVSNEELSNACGNILLDLAVERVVAELSKDKEPGSYYHTWQGNIAMAFVDAHEKWHADNDFIFYNEFKPALVKIANAAAKNFLNNLCNQPKITEPKKPSE